MTAWQEIRDLITERRTGALADQVIELSEAERAEVAARLPEFVTELRDTAARLAREYWIRELGRGEEVAGWPAWARAEAEVAVRWRVGNAMQAFEAPMRVAGAGTIAGPAAVATWLTRRDLTSRWAPVLETDDLLRVLTARPAVWRADVAARLTERIRRPDDRIVPLALRLMRDCAASLPGAAAPSPGQPAGPPEREA